MAVNGCFWHGIFFLASIEPCKYSLFYALFTGCLKCYVSDTVNTINGKTMHDPHQATTVKTIFLEDQGFKVLEVWEYDIKRELERDEEMKWYFEHYEVVDPLEPREAFF